jgi:glutamate formiminotransferase
MNPEAIIECVPNFSEGNDAAKVTQIVSAMQVDGVRLLDWSLDKAHNRSVVTIAGTSAGIVEAAVRAAGKAAELIDLTKQSGVHPRIGAPTLSLHPRQRGIPAGCARSRQPGGPHPWSPPESPSLLRRAARAARPHPPQKMCARASSKALATPPPRRLATFPISAARASRNSQSQRRRCPQLPHRLQRPPQGVRHRRSDHRPRHSRRQRRPSRQAIGVFANGRAQGEHERTDFNLTPMRHVHTTSSTSRSGACPHRRRRTHRIDSRAAYRPQAPNGSVK